MKFGKTIQSQQVPGWTEYYLNYKALKKIINSYAAGRPASDASLLSLGLRPAKRPHNETSPHPPPSASGHVQSSSDLDPLPPETEPPAPSRGSLMDGGKGSGGKEESFKAHRDVFFFTLQRELEKINTFYLIKERDLRLRLLNLLTNRKRLSLSTATTPFTSPTSTSQPEWTSLEEGWRLFERDLGKLQGFIEINATGFRKILKKWDKRSKSNTKEMYLERQVEVQPCFNREFIAKLSDIVAANLLDLESGSGGEGEIGLEGLEGVENASRLSAEEEGGGMFVDVLVDLETGLGRALGAGTRDALVDWLKIAKARQGKGNDRRLMRILWRAAIHVPDDQVDLVLSSLTLDYKYVDDINGRSPLHLAAIAGSLRVATLCVETDPDLLEKPDTYDRQPLHYAAMHGHPSIVSFLLERANPSSTDMDGYTPLMHGITQGHLEVVRIFVNSGKAALEPTAVSSDLIPLSLACQAGHLEVARLLLERGASIIPNSEGLFPQHFAAKAGHSSICQLLVQSGGTSDGGKDKADKYNLWTPLHHAAAGGQAHHLNCIKVLVEAGCDVNVADEYGKSPGWYAAWFGHVECLNYLLEHGARLSGKMETLEGMEGLGLAADIQMDGLSPGSDLDLDQSAVVGEEFELIPSLSLPPPIIPLRVYGHEFLAKKSLVQLSLGHPFARSENKPPPVKLYSRTSQQSLHFRSSLKLVLASKSDTSSVPHSVVLPLADEREVFAFQLSSLESFTLELSLYPTFGSRVIGRAVILPGTFVEVDYHRALIVPLLDHQLKAIGEVAFEVSCIRPFEGAQLEIGGKVETYWKSKVTPSAPTQDHAHARPANPNPRPVASVTTSGSTQESALVTASSLSGEYVHVVVQVTKDGVPVAYPHWRLPIDGFDIGVSDVTLQQFLSLAKTTSQTFRLPDSGHNPSTADYYTAIAESLVSLEDLLASIPSEIGFNVQPRYARVGDSIHESVGRSGEVNTFVDEVLRVVYDAGRKVGAGAVEGGGGGVRRKIIFSSFDPTVCTALNWKQPNYAVFFASYCGISRESNGQLVPVPEGEETDLRCLSVRQAVNFAKSTNLLGVILEATTLAAVPSLVASVKDAGLLLATFGRGGQIGSLRQGGADERTVDAFVIDGIMTLTI